MIGIELVKGNNSSTPAPDLTEKVVQYCKENGLLVPTYGIHHNVIRLLLSLVINKSELDEGIQILKDAIAFAVKKQF